MANDTVTLVFAGDSKSLDAATKNVVKDLDSVADKSEHVGRSTAELGEKLDEGSKKFRGGADAIDGASASLESLGVAIPGPIGNVLTLTRGLADLADGIATTVLPLLGKLKVAALATLGPWGLIAVAVIALGAAFVVAYKKSETFRDIVHAVVNTVKTVVEDLVGYLKTAAKIAFLPWIIEFDLVKKAWDETIGRLSLPAAFDKVASIGGKVGGAIGGIFHANGGRVNAGEAIIGGERGPELFVPSVPGMIMTNNQLRGGAGGGGGAVRVTFDFTGANDELARALRKMVRVQGGGDVQLAFGN